MSDESGRTKQQVSTEGGNEPLWARSGRQLFYRNGDRMMVVDIVTSPQPAIGKPRVLFTGHYFSDIVHERTQYDVTPDGKRFLMFKAANETLNRCS